MGSREPSTAVVPAAKMRVAEAVATTEMATMTTTMAAEMAAVATTVAAAMTSSVATAPADRRAGKQDRQNNDRNSDGPFGHGNSPHTPLTWGR
jgi:hypothetical protein